MTMLVENGQHGMVILVATALTLIGVEGKDHRKIILDSGYTLQVLLILKCLWLGRITPLSCALLMLML